MLELPQDQMTSQERALLRRLRGWIVALAVACVVAGIGIGAMLAGRPAVAQNDVAATARAPEALSASFAEIARRVEPAVVNIDTKTAAPEIAEGDGNDKEDQSGSNSLLDMFRRQARRPAKGVGSGFIVDSRGFILTNQHVVEGTTRIIIRLQSGEELIGRVVGVDEETDVAVVKVDAGRELPTLKLGDSGGVEVGDWVLAIGSPFGLDQTVTAGIISKKDRQSPYFTSFQQFLQTDAAINRGNSGGPLVNMRGEVVGINSQIASTTGDYNGIGFALPSNEVSFVYQQIVAQGKVRRGYLGIILDSVKSEFARVYGLPEARGVIVTDVREPNGPAGKAGILANDIIVEYNGQVVTNAQDLIAKVASTAVGQTVTVAYLRDINGKLERRTANITIGERPASLATRNERTLPQRPDDNSSNNNGQQQQQNNQLRLGLKLEEMSAQSAADRNLTGVRGLLIKDVDPNGIAADVRLPGTNFPAINEGDIILRINRVNVSTLADFARVVNTLKPGDAIVLNVARYNRESQRIVQRVVQFTYQ